MSANNTDNFMQVAVAGSETTLAAPGKSIGAGSINLTSGSGWPTTTGIILAIRRVDSNGAYVPGTYTEWAGVLSGNTITLNPTPLYGTDQTYAADGLTQVYMPVSASWANRVINAILAQHSQAGAHVGLTNTGGANFTGGITTDSLVITGQNVANGWTALGQTLTYNANNGQKEFQCTAGVDLRSSLAVGMKIQVTRNTVPPTQCMAFTAASSQYATKSSPAGISFTSAFTVEAWIYVNSYTGATNGIITRYDGASNGFYFYLTSTGQLKIGYASSAAFTDWTTYQSVPLKRWIHVAASVTSVSSKTLGGIYINGISVPTFSSTASSTTLTQAGNLSLGALATTNYLDGYISEARIWSVAQSASAIQSNMAINLVGNESNLVALFQGNGNFNDATSNANNLTANGGAIATQAANPFNAIEYGFITSISYSNPTTTLKIFCGTDYMIPNMTLNSAQLSVARTPYGGNWQRGHWICDTVIYASAAQNSPAQNTWYNLGGYAINIPTGAWRASYEVQCGADGSAAVERIYGALSTTNNGSTDIELQSVLAAWAVTGAQGTLAKSKHLDIASLTPYYFNVRTTTASLTHLYLGDAIEVDHLVAECAYL